MKPRPLGFLSPSCHLSLQPLIVASVCSYSALGCSLNHYFWSQLLYQLYQWIMFKKTKVVSVPWLSHNWYISSGMFFLVFSWKCGFPTQHCYLSGILLTLGNMTLFSDIFLCPLVPCWTEYVPTPDPADQSGKVPDQTWMNETIPWNNMTRRGPNISLSLLTIH